MSMKKTVLTFLAWGGCLLASAQPTTTPAWSEAISGVEKAEDVYRTAPIATTVGGDVILTGSFTQTLVFGNSFLEPIANSAYLAKYSAAGAPQWAVSLAGAATITAVTTDADDNVYIAGVMADQVVFGSTDGQTATLEGRKADDGSWETSLSSSFIAKYDKDGALKLTRTFVPAADPALVTTGLYFAFDGDLFFKINHLQADKDKVYASALYTGQTVAGDLTFSGTAMDMFGWGYMDLRAAGVFSLSAETLEAGEKLLELKTTDAMTNALQHEANAVNFTVDNGTVYAACIGYGNLTLTTPAGSTDYSFVVPNSDEVTYDHIVTSINGSQVNTKVFPQPELETISKSTLGGMQTYGNDLYIAGSYNEKLTFAPAVTSTNATDLYVVKFNKETLDVAEAYTSSFDEEGSNQNQEIFTSLFVAKGTVYLNGYNEVMSSHEILTPLAYTIDARGLQRTADATLVTSAAGDDNISVFAGIDDQQRSTVSCYATVDAIEEVKGTATATLRLAGDMIYLTEPADITLYNTQGRAVLTVRNATSLNISALNRGCYIARVSGKSGAEVLKFAKTR